MTLWSCNVRGSSNSMAATWPTSKSECQVKKVSWNWKTLVCKRELFQEICSGYRWVQCSFKLIQIHWRENWRTSPLYHEKSSKVKLKNCSAVTAEFLHFNDYIYDFRNTWKMQNTLAHVLVISQGCIMSGCFGHCCLQVFFKAHCCHQVGGLGKSGFNL